MLVGDCDSIPAGGRVHQAPFSQASQVLYDHQDRKALLLYHPLAHEDAPGNSATDYQLDYHN